MRPIRLSLRRDAAGQAMVIMVGGMVAVIALVALVIDGGNAWAQQRIVQNGSDAAAEAGAVVMAQEFAGATAPAGGWDAAVANAVSASAAANDIAVTAAYYTDVCGIPLKADGTAALTPTFAYDLSSALAVGTGVQPVGSNTTPNCPSHTVGPAAGVVVYGQKQVPTYLAGIIGMTNITVSTQATAVSGFLQESCSANTNEACAVLPVIIPVDVITCSGSNNIVDTGLPWSADGQTVYKVPLCKNGPGNVGWVDWTPPAGGTSELIQQIQNPTNPAVALPSWQYMAQTGNPNAAGVESAMRAYDGEIVLIPQFDLTCNPGPGASPDSTSPAINTGPGYGCPAGALGGNGQNQWYRVPSFAHFQLCISTDPDCQAAGVSYGAYLNGNNSSVCDTGNGATSCLVGKFESIVSTGTVGPGYGGGTGNSKAVGVQLIK